jgi:glycyl-tRNA synthetase (class II)
MQAGVMERKLFTIPSFKIYGGVAGFFDFGPPGCAVKQNITQLWRQHFILEENMLEVGAKPRNIIGVHCRSLKRTRPRDFSSSAQGAKKECN